MKFSTLALTLGSAIFVSAQDITSLPQCAQGPILQAITDSGCPLTEIDCVCQSKKFISGLLAKIPTVCTPEEVLTAAKLSIELCGAYGVDLIVTLASTTVGGTATTDSAPESASATTEVSTTSSVEVAETTSSGAKDNTASVTPTPTASNAGGSASTPTPTPTQTPSAALMNKVDNSMKGLIVMLGLGAFFWI